MAKERKLQGWWQVPLCDYHRFDNWNFSWKSDETPLLLLSGDYGQFDRGSLAPGRTTLDAGADAVLGRLYGMAIAF